jgi:putative Holliday junction resolvase
VTAAARPRVVAVDFGDRRTGLAATDPSGTLALPLPALRDLSTAACAAEVAAVARERGADAIVVGLPLDARGRVGTRARRTYEFVDALRRVAPCPVHTVDETFSTDEAHERLRALGLRAARRRAVADSVAALVICERYLALRQGHRRGHATPPPDRG